MPLREDIGKAYETYYTHSEISLPFPQILSLYWSIRDSYLPRKFGKQLGVGPAWCKYLSPLADLFPSLRTTLERRIMYLPTSIPGARLLEVGCGSGQLLGRMQARGWQVEGVDFDPQAIAAARSKGLQARLGDLSAQDYPVSQFDTIYLGHVIEHLHEPLELLQECYRILKPGGLLVVITPNAESWGHKRFKESWRGLEPPRHLHIFSLRNLPRAIEKANFKMVRASTIATGAYYILTASRALARGIAPGAGMNIPKGQGQLLSGLLYQAAEVALRVIRPQVGEEVLITARKL
jgi:2-polyprenyl-3-methyl-5-hydroxy-6-metoxy-1,4-benzoquinol methylase